MKRYLIVSDTHGRDTGLGTVILREEPFDVLIHLGDVEGSENIIESLAKGKKCIFLRGNNDFFVPNPREMELEIGTHRALLTHGHYYGVSLGYERLAEEAASRGCDIAMCGHTHKPTDFFLGTTRILNPGSISFPRQENHIGTYIVLTEDEGEIKSRIYYV